MSENQKGFAAFLAKKDIVFSAKRYVTPGGDFVYARSKRRFAPDKKARSSQSAVSLVTTGFPSASSSGVNPPAYPLTIKR